MHRLPPRLQGRTRRPSAAIGLPARLVGMPPPVVGRRTSGRLLARTAWTVGPHRGVRPPTGPGRPRWTPCCRRCQRWPSRTSAAPDAGDRAPSITWSPPGRVRPAGTGLDRSRPRGLRAWSSTTASPPGPGPRRGRRPRLAGIRVAGSWWWVGLGPRDRDRGSWPTDVAERTVAVAGSIYVACYKHLRWRGAVRHVGCYNQSGWPCDHPTSTTGCADDDHSTTRDRRPRTGSAGAGPASVPAGLERSLTQVARAILRLEIPQRRAGRR